MEFQDLEEQLYHLYCNSEFKKIISIARKEFLKGNREIFIWTFLSDAYCSIEKFKKRGKFLSKIALDLINEELKKKETEKLLFYYSLLQGNLENYEETLKALDKLIKIKPKNHKYYDLKACLKYKLNQYDESIKLFDKANELNPGNTKYLINRARVKFHKGDYENSINDFDKAIEQVSNNPDYYFERGYVKYCIKDYESAIIDLDKSIKINPNNPKYYLARIDVIHDGFNAGLISPEIFDNAKDCDILIKLESQNDFFYYKRATYNKLKFDCRLSEKNILENVINDLNIAINLNPNQAEYYNIRGCAKYELERAALKDHLKAIELNPNIDNYYYNSGCDYMLLKDYNNAKKYFDKAIELNPNKSDYYHERGIAKGWLKNYKGKLEDLTKAIELNLNPYYSRYYRSIIITKCFLQDYQGALDDLNQLIKLSPRISDYYYWRSNIKSKLFDYKGSIKDFNTANIKYYVGKARTSSFYKDYKNALDYFNKAIILSPNNSPYYAERGFIKYHLNLYNEAIRDYSHSIKLDNTYTLAYVEKAKLIFENNQKEALELLLTALKNCENDKDNIFTALSFVYFSQNDYKKALKYADEAILFNKENGTGYYRKYCALVALGKQEEAREALEKANALGYEEMF